MAKADRQPIEITVPEVSVADVLVRVVGTSPLIMNCMSAKARRELLIPKGRKTRADRALGPKHDPPSEYQHSVYFWNKDVTLLAFPALAFKDAIMTAALDMPGTYRTQIGRLVWVNGWYVPVWGVPQVFMAVVRSADINRTPDVRTRAILPEWCSEINLRFMTPFLSADAIMRLLYMAGMTAGVGDFRQEKGKGSFGQFRICAADDEEFLRIRDSGGRSEQTMALENPEPFDPDTAEMLSWFADEAAAR